MNTCKFQFLLWGLILVFVSCSGSNNRLGYETEETQMCNTSEEFIDVTDCDSNISPILSESSKSRILSEEYSDSRFKIYFPSSWEIVQRNAKATANTTIAVQIMEKECNEYDFRPNVNVIFSKERHSEDTSELARLSYNQAKEMGLTKSFIGIKDCKIGQCYGSFVEYIASINGYSLHIYQYIVKKPDSSTIIITATLDQAKIQKQSEIAQDIINSIVIN